MKTLKKDIIVESVEVGRATSKVAEALQTELDLLYADILLDKDMKATSVNQAYASMQKRTERLFNLALNEFSNINADVQKNASKLINQSLKGANRIQRIDNKDEIKKYIKRITGDQLRENKKITYRNGRQIGFKEYVEMATRTRMQKELLDQTKKIGVATMQLFYICDTYSDCANDHIDYQGQMYYDEQVLNSIDRDNPHFAEIMRGVRKCKMSVEKVTTGKPYLVTRPNCRHRLIPISIDDAIGLSRHQVLRKNRADKGNYNTSDVKKNYDDSQKQRKIEHAIRTHKRNLAIREKAYKNTGDPEYLKMADRSKYGIRLQQSNMRKLIASNDTLKRDYRRENPYHLQKDLGVAYNTEPIRAGFEVPKTEIQEWNDDMILEDIQLVRETEKWVDELTDHEKEVLDDYTFRGYEDMNEYMYNNEGFKARVSTKVYEEIKEKVSTLHSIFTQIKEKDIQSNKGLVVYRGGADLVQENDTTIIANSFTSTSLYKDVALDFVEKTDMMDIEPAVYKIIMPPESQNQALFSFNEGEAEVLIDTNSVYDIVEVEKIEVEGNYINQYTLLLRPKHKGVIR